MELPNIKFAEGDSRLLASKLKEVYEAVRQAHGEPTYRMHDGEPIRLIQLTEAALLSQINTDIDITGKGNLLYFAGEETIEHIGLLYGERGRRLQPTPARTTIRYILSAPRNVTTVIPQGSRLTPDNRIFFATTQNLEILAGETVGEVSAEALTNGSVGNGFLAGEIRNIVDRNPFVQSAENITESTAGTDLEDIESYRARIQLLPESFSVAGPDGAYEFWAKTANSDIVDVAVWSPEPGEVNIVPLMKNGELPSEEVLTQVYETLNDRKIRPLTDLVHVLSPTIVDYEINVDYWVSEENIFNLATIEQAILDAISGYIGWQETKLGRNINPSQLHFMIMSAGATGVKINEPLFRKLENSEVAKNINIFINGEKLWI